MQVDHPKTIASAVVISVIGLTGILATPILVGAAVDYLQFSPQQVSSVILAELGGVALASLMATLWIRRINWKAAAAFALIVVVVGNVFSSQQTTLASLVLLRFLTGFLGQGTAFALALGIISETTAKDRNFGFAISAQVATGVLTLLVLPPIVKSVGGISGVLIPLAGLALFALPTVIWVPHGSSRKIQVDTATQNPSVWPAIQALVVLLIWCTGLGAMWAFIERIGVAAGLEPTAVGQALALSTAIAVTGSLTASAIGDRFGRIAPVTVALAMQIVMIFFLKGEMSWLRFAVSAAIFQWFWNLTGPYLMGTVAMNDSTGRVSVMMSAAQTGGFALGPALAGAMMAPDSLLAANYVGMTLCAAALALFVPTALGLNRRLMAQSS